MLDNAILSACQDASKFNSRIWTSITRIWLLVRRLCWFWRVWTVLTELLSQRRARLRSGVWALNFETRYTPRLSLSFCYVKKLYQIARKLLSGLLVHLSQFSWNILIVIFYANHWRTNLWMLKVVYWNQCPHWLL